MSQASTSTFRAKARFFGYLFFVGGVILAFWAVWLLGERIHVATTYQRTKGTVVGHRVRERMVRSGRITAPREFFTPVVRYRTKRGEYFIEGDVEDQAPIYKTGEAVTVLYLPNQPEQGKIENFNEMYFTAAFRGLLAVVLFVCSWVAFLVPKLKDNTTDQDPAQTFQVAASFPK